MGKVRKNSVFMHHSSVFREVLHSCRNFSGLNAQFVPEYAPTNNDSSRSKDRVSIQKKTNLGNQNFSHGSVQFKMVSTRSGKPICGPLRLYEISSVPSLKYRGRL